MTADGFKARKAMAARKVIADCARTIEVLSSTDNPADADIDGAAYFLEEAMLALEGVRSPSNDKGSYSGVEQFRFKLSPAEIERLYNAGPGRVHEVAEAIRREYEQGKGGEKK